MQEMMAMMMPQKINACTHDIKKTNVCTRKIEITENYYTLKALHVVRKSWVLIFNCSLCFSNSY
ncbi:hypothetical protein DPMN_194926 [Dreissena polymorpha]|uniref:Uncharacterized protein n=1 Tax=Dreissena polymorpha TaxID=45954 RepID=A0A9D3Y539_DREPO|nr:hypothetical protein DPMN_194926 [Dreissena polymorpha]